MKNKIILWLSFLITLSIVLYSCRNEDFSHTETNTQRKNSDFFKHALKNGASAKSGVDYINILDVYNQETGFLSKMPDQKGMPIWDKMQVFDAPDATGLMIPLSYDNETLSSVLFATLDSHDRITGVRDFDNSTLEGIVYNDRISKDFREQMFYTFMMVDNHTFGNEYFTNIPKDLFLGKKYDEEYGRMKIKDFSTSPTITSHYAGKLIYIENCGSTWNCKNHESWDKCDHCGACYNTSCSTTVIWVPDEPFPGASGGGGGGGGGGGTSTPQPPKDPCTVSAEAFYRIKPGCDGNNGGTTNLNDPCITLQAQSENAEFINGIQKLKNNLTLKKETGYIEKNTGSFTYQENANATEDANTLSLPDPDYYKDIRGFMHTHPNNFEDSNGNMRIGFKIFSPADVIYLNELVRNANENGTPLGEVYAIMVSEKGTYQIRFTGNVHQIKTVYANTKEQYNDMYKEYFKENSKRSDELNSFKFMDEHMVDFPVFQTN
ncbi:hypothetical protein [Chryseobacterium populi]|uniref:4Fe-4S ferredoxin-type domain-containing protein n=1 Tax=Chryseobacterium populi TaxID=1144316 RepID=J2SWT0_9FLAO|nr:hypothetical protein [Chryseobacterium populi]EJL70047.1 hypothetical protein PMI13_03062 [Chryseobacterium populi]